MSNIVHCIIISCVRPFYTWLYFCLQPIVWHCTHIALILAVKRSQIRFLLLSLKGKRSVSEIVSLLLKHHFMSVYKPYEDCLIVSMCVYIYMTTVLDEGNQLYSPAALFPRCSSRYPYDRRLGSPQSWCWDGLCLYWTPVFWPMVSKFFDSPISIRRKIYV
jgi:hypothetical protein